MTIVKYQNHYNTIEFQKQKIAAMLITVKEFICKEFIHGGQLIALGTAGIVLSFMFLYNATIRWEFLLIIYLGTLCIYNYDYYKGFAEDSLNNIDRTSYLKKTHKYRFIIVTFYGISFFSMLIYFGNLSSIIFGGLILLSAILYTYKIKKLTTKIIGFKSYYTAFSFSLSIIFTALYCSYPINLVIFVFFGFVFLQILLITSFCDLKDIVTDKKNNLLTLPIFFGKNKFLQFLHILNLASLILIITAIIMELMPLFSIFLFFSYLYCFYFIQKAKNVKTNIHYLTNVIVDAEYFFWPLFLFLGKTLIAYI
jgi:4-hydroxybenzoate polyprenyltransferase